MTPAPAWWEGRVREASVEAPAGSGTVRVAYTEWGDPKNPVSVLCVHGLTRNGRDFDALAEALAPGARVICPDMPGRGQSGWLADPTLYATPTYLGVLKHLLSTLGVGRVRWVGTSMGGLLGMVSAAAPETILERLVINDIGPYLPQAALQRIAGYLGEDLRFPDRGALETYLRRVHATFGPLTDEQWAHLARHGARADPKGGMRLHYDPQIRAAFAALATKDQELWGLWDAIRCPTLVLRGGESDLLLAPTAEDMRHRGPKARVVTWPGIGHAPALMDPVQIAVVKGFLLGDPEPQANA